MKLLPLLLLVCVPSLVQAQFAFTTNSDGSLNVSQYTGPGGLVNIPSTTNGLSVTSIGTNAFQSCLTLTAVTIPDSVTTIEYNAFFDCYYLTSVRMGTNVTTLEAYAFGNCGKLANVTLPNGVTSIGTYAFGGCGLTNVTIPNSVISLGLAAFYDCNRMTGLTIGTKISSLPEAAFTFCTNLTSVTIPNSVTSIGIDAFGQCTHLTNVTIGTGVTSIQSNAFYNCFSLVAIYFKGNAPSLGSLVFYGDNLATIYYLPQTIGWSSPFGGLPAWIMSAGSLQVVLSPIGAITNGAQWQVDGGAAQPSGAVVTGLPVGSHTISFGPANGWAMPASQSIDISTSSTATANGIYGQLTYVTNNVGGIIITKCTNGGSLIIPGTINGLPVTTIAAQAFLDIQTLTNVTIPSSVTNIGLSAFAICGRLTGIYFQGNAPSLGSSGSDDVWGSDPNVTIYYLPGTSGWSPSMNGRPTVMLNPPNPAGSLKVTLSPVEAISNAMRWQVDGGVAQFSGATVVGLSVGSHTVSFSTADGWAIPPSQSIDISANLTAATSGTYGRLTYITNNGAITITKCTNGGVYILPSTISGLPVTSIGNQAFQNITTLTNITIPGSVTNIGFSAFGSCGRLAGIFFQGNAPVIDSSAFGNDSLTNYYLPGTSGWTPLINGRPTVMLNPPNPAGSLKVFLTPVAAISNGMQWQVDGGVAQPGGTTVTGLPVGNHTVTFSTADGWAIPPSQSITVTANSTTITSGTYGQLTYVTNNGAITITKCTNSGVFILPSTISGLPVTSIGNQAFANINNLTNITVPSSVTNIGFSAFANCGRLAGIYFQGNAPTTDPSAFSGDSSLTIYCLPGTSGWGSFLNGHPVVMLNAPDPAGSLKVTLAPSSITNAAQWQVDGGVAQPGGATVAGLSVGNHTISFSPLNGWAMPGSQTVAVSANSTATASGIYGQLTYTTNNGAITITKYTGNSGATTILPSVINGLTVTTIGNQAFQNANSLTGITIPSSVTNIGTGTFAVFNGLSTLTSLMTITVDPANSFYSSADGVLFNKSKTVLIQFPPAAGGSYLVPQSVTNIGNNAFIYCTSLTNVTMPYTITSIGNGAFDDCYSLTNVIIPPNVITIGASAFQGCTSLANITIPNTVTSIGSYAFYFCTNLVNVTIGAHVAYIGANVFLQCANLTAIYFAGNPPNLFNDFDDFDDTATVYFLPGTAGWGTPGTPFGGRPTAFWLPRAQTGDGSLGVQANQFGFNLTWASDTVVVVEASTDLANPNWTPVGTNTLTSGSSYFSDSQWTNYPGRFYRLRSSDF